MDINNNSQIEEKLEKIRTALRVKLQLENKTIKDFVIAQVKKEFFKNSGRLQFDSEDAADFDIVREMEFETPKGLTMLKQIEDQLVYNLYITGSLGDDAA